jgi:hypothetical protein
MPAPALVVVRRDPEPDVPHGDGFDRLAMARARLLEGDGVLDPGLARLVAAALETVLAGRDRAAAVALRRASLHRRDELIRQAAATFYTGSPRARAMALLQDAERYAATSWRADRGCVGCPERIRGTVQEALWHAYKSHPVFPSSLRQVQNILAPDEVRNT